MALPNVRRQQGRGSASEFLPHRLLHSLAEQQSGLGHRLIRIRLDVRQTDDSLECPALVPGEVAFSN